MEGYDDEYVDDNAAGSAFVADVEILPKNYGTSRTKFITAVPVNETFFVDGEILPHQESYVTSNEEDDTQYSIIKPVAIERTEDLFAPLVEAAVTVTSSSSVTHVTSSSSSSLPSSSAVSSNQPQSKPSLAAHSLAADAMMPLDSWQPIAAKGAKNDDKSKNVAAMPLSQEEIQFIGDLHYSIATGNLLEVAELTDSVETQEDLEWIIDQNHPDSKMNSFIMACYCGSISIVALLISKGCNKSSLHGGSSAATALIVALQQSHLPLATMLIARGFEDINAIEKKESKSALHILCVGKFKNCKTSQVHELITLLVSKGADLNQRMKNGFTPIMIAVSESNMELLQMLLKFPTLDLKLPNNDGKTVFDIASSRRLFQVTKALEGYKGSADNAKSQDGATDSSGVTESPKKPGDVKGPLLNSSPEKPSPSKLKESPVKKSSPNKSAMTSQELSDYVDASSGSPTKRSPKPVNTQLNTGDLPYIPEELSDSNLSSIIGLNSAAAGSDSMAIQRILKDDGALSNYYDEFGQSILMTACRNGSLAVAALLLSHGALIDHAALDGTTALSMSILEEKVDVVKMLISKSADVNYEEADMTPLMYACEVGNLSIVIALIEAGAHVGHQVEGNGWTALMHAAKAGSTVVVEYIMGLDKEDQHGNLVLDINAINEVGMTALIIASVGGHADVVSILIQNEARVNVQAIDGSTAIVRACKLKHSAVAILLITSSICMLDKQDSLGLTALIVSVMNGLEEVATLLVKNSCKLNLTNAMGNTALMIATKMGEESVVDMLASYGADVNVANKQGWTALLIAAEKGYIRILATLLSRGASLHVQSSDNDTALLLACSNGHTDLVTLLISKGCDCEYYVPLIRAAENDYLEIVKILVMRGVNINAENKEGMTAFNVACEKGFFQLAAFLAKKGADMAVPDNEGITPLMRACRTENVNIVEMIAGNRVNLNIQDPDTGETVLISACRDGYFSIVELLVFENAELEIESMDGKTALIVAIESNNMAIAEFLIEQGAKVDARTERNGWTALNMAVSKRNVAAVRYLAGNGADMNPGEFDDNAKSPLGVAAAFNFVDMIKLLEMYGAEVHGKSKGNETPLLIAAGHGHVEVVSYLMKSCRKKVLNAQSLDGSNALSKACDGAHKVVVKLLLENGGLNTNTVDVAGNTVAHKVCKVGAVDVAQYLLQGSWRRKEIKAILNSRAYKLDVSTECDMNLPNREGLTPLMVACESNQVDVVKLLVKSPVVDPNFSSLTTNAALLTAVERGSYDCVVALLSAETKKRSGAFDKTNIEIRTRSKWTPIIIACDRNYEQIAEFLCKAGCDVNSYNNKRTTALMKAAERGQESVLNILLRYPVNLDFQDADGATALFKAISSRQYECARRLIIRGANSMIATNDGKDIWKYMVDLGHGSLDKLLVLLSGGNEEVNFADNHADFMVGSQMTLIRCWIDILPHYLAKCSSPIGVLDKCLSIILTSLRHRSSFDSGIPADDVKQCLLFDFTIVYDLIKLSVAIKLAHDEHPLEQKFLQSRFQFIQNMLSRCMNCDALKRNPNLVSFLLLSLKPSVSQANYHTLCTKHLHVDHFRLNAMSDFTLRDDNPVYNLACSLFDYGPLHLALFFKLTGFLNTTAMLHHIDRLLYSTNHPVQLGAIRIPDFYACEKNYWWGFLHRLRSAYLYARFCPAMCLAMEMTTKLKFLILSTLIRLNVYYRTCRVLLIIMLFSGISYEVGLYEACDYKSLVEYLKHFSIWHTLYCVSLFFLVLWNVSLDVTYRQMSSSSLLSIAMVPMCLSFLQYPSVFRSIGPNILLLWYFIFDIWNLILLYLSISVAFGIALYYVMLNPYITWNEKRLDFTTSPFAYSSLFDSPQDIFYTMLNALFGVHDFQAFRHSDSQSFYLDASGAQEEMFNYFNFHKIFHVYSIVIFVIYIVVVSVVIMNIIVSRIVTKYSEFSVIAEENWSIEHCALAQRFMLVKEQSPLCMLPVPFNLLSGILYPVHHLYLYAVRWRWTWSSHGDDDSEEVSVKVPSVVSTISNIVLLTTGNLAGSTLITACMLVYSRYLKLKNNAPKNTPQLFKKNVPKQPFKFPLLSFLGPLLLCLCIPLCWIVVFFVEFIPFVVRYTPVVVHVPLCTHTVYSMELDGKSVSRKGNLLTIEGLVKFAKLNFYLFYSQPIQYLYSYLSRYNTIVVDKCFPGAEDRTSGTRYYGGADNYILSYDSELLEKPRPNDNVHFVREQASQCSSKGTTAVATAWICLTHEYSDAHLGTRRVMLFSKNDKEIIFKDVFSFEKFSGADRASGDFVDELKGMDEEDSAISDDGAHFTELSTISSRISALLFNKERIQLQNADC